MNEDNVNFSQNLKSFQENIKEPFSEHYDPKKDYLNDSNFIMEDDFKSEVITLILEMEKSIKIEIDSSTKDSSDNEAVSEVIKILNSPINTDFSCKKCYKEICSCIRKPKPVYNYGKVVINSKYKQPVYIARRVPLKTKV